MTPTPFIRQSAIYTGKVRHRRHGPKKHIFHMGLFMVYLDLDELPRLFKGRWFWSTARFAPAWFRRADHFGEKNIPLKEAVRNLVRERLGLQLEGPVRLLTHLRYWGFVFNPISIFYCFDATGNKVEAIVAEVTNTPWKERRLYVLHLEHVSTKRLQCEFAKTLHVSPFLDMDYQYLLQGNIPGSHLVFHLENRHEGICHFEATLTLKRREMTSVILAGALIRFPWMTGQVIARIYFEALRLWLKRIPYVPRAATIPTEEPIHE